MPTQKETILDILADNNFHCTSEMYAAFIADPRTRLAELSKEHNLEWRWCQSHNHKGQMKEWRLNAPTIPSEHQEIPKNATTGQMERQNELFSLATPGSGHLSVRKQTELAEIEDLNLKLRALWQPKQRTWPELKEIETALKSHNIYLKKSVVNKYL